MVRLLLNPSNTWKIEPDIDALVEAERIVMRAGPRPLISLDVMPILAAFCAPGHGLSILIAFVVLVRGYVNSVIIAQM